MLNNYPGAKTNSGIIQWLVNDTPEHEHYAELYAGSAQLFDAKRPAPGGNYLRDINPAVVAALQNKYCTRAHISLGSALDFLQAHQLTRRWFIYLDPPYPYLSRRSGAKIYKYEMGTDLEHVQLLSAVAAVDANIKISTRQNELYDQHLAGWRKEEFKTMGHHGPVTEIAYMNYPPPLLLHQYDYIGNGYVDRQRVKRKITRFASKLQELPLYERHLFIQEMIKNDLPAVQHFLSMAAGIADINCGSRKHSRL